MKNSSMSDPVDRSVVALLVLLGLFVGYRPIADMDFHFHLGMGRAHLVEGPRLSADPFTFLPTIRPSDMGAWGAATLFALLDRLGGFALCQLLIALGTALFYVLAYRLGRRLAGPPQAALLICALAAATSMHRIRVRPDLFSLIGSYWLLEWLEREPRDRRRIELFLLTLLWANLHPAVVFAPLLILARSLGADFRSRLKDLAIVLVAIAITPRGPLDGFDLALQTARCGDLVPEWWPLWRLGFAGYAGEWILLTATGLLLVAGSKRLRGDLGRLALAWLCFLLALRGFRMLYLLPVVWAQVLGRYEGLLGPPRRARPAVAAAIALIALMPLRDRVERAIACRRFGLSPFAAEYLPNFPREARDFLAGSGLEGHVFSPVRWGGYLGLGLAPKLRTAHDGRVSLFGKELAEELLRFPEKEARARLIDRFALEILVLPPGELPADEVFDGGKDPGPRRWLAVHADPTAVVWVDVRGPHRRENLAALGLGIGGK